MAVLAEDPVTWLDVAPIAISTLAVALSVVSLWRTERRAKDAELRQLWSEAIEAVLRLPLDPATEDVGDRLVTLRVRFMALVDGLRRWDGLDEWLAAEHRFGAALGRHVQETADPRLPPAQYVEALKPYMNWSMRLSNNLRHLRNTGYDRKQIADLKDGAEWGIGAVYAKNGWGEPEYSADFGKLGI